MSTFVVLCAFAIPPPISVGPMALERRPPGMSDGGTAEAAGFGSSFRPVLTQQVVL